jgi:hypothetical protein
MVLVPLIAGVTCNDTAAQHPKHNQYTTAEETAEGKALCKFYRVVELRLDLTQNFVSHFSRLETLKLF